MPLDFKIAADIMQPIDDVASNNVHLFGYANYSTCFYELLCSIQLHLPPLLEVASDVISSRAVKDSLIDLGILGQTFIKRAHLVLGSCSSQGHLPTY